MTEMFCFQCEQTARGTGCTVKGVCGKPADVANKMDELTSALIRLARAAYGKIPSREADEAMMQGIFAVLTNVDLDLSRLEEYRKIAEREKKTR